MAKSIRTEILIHATPEKIWRILTDFTHYPQWNPFITSIQGNTEIGNKITVHIKIPGGSTMTFKPTVQSNITNKELSWKGKVLFNGLFDGEHKFELIDHGNATTTFVQSEQFTGIFAGLFNPPKTEYGFNEMNRQLKMLAEKQ